MIGKIRKTIREHDLLTPGDTVLVAVSGGVDSVVLLHTLWQLRGELRVSLAVVHVDHGLRDEESTGDARFVEELAKRYELPCYSKKFDVARYAEEQKTSIQVAARTLRYGFFTEVAQQIGATKIVTAHHADDQVETVLMRIVRGTTVRGIGGIPIRRLEEHYELVRPFLEIWREEIETAASEYKLAYREDSSNASLKYLRNKIRLQLIPELEQVYNNGVKGALTQLSRLARDDEQFLAELAEQAFRETVVEDQRGRMRVDAKKLAERAIPLQRRVITLILYYLLGHTKQWEQVQVENIRYLLTSREPGSELPLPCGLIAWREYDRLYIGDAKTRTVSEAPGVVLFSFPGEFTLESYGIRFELQVVSGVPPRPANAWEVQFDADELSNSRIYIRTWVRGDTYRPFGFHGTKLISDVLGEAKIPKHKRSGWPLLMVDDTIAWVVGIRRGHIGSVSADTRHTLVIRAVPIL